ncbi:F0F1 ATP synthase subunit beta, partial [Mycoplasmopsis synoviae]
IVARARKIRNFLSQPFTVAKKFSGIKGSYDKLSDTIRSFKQILNCNLYDYPEDIFRYAGSIDDVIGRYKK